jgi:hypothetical protein
LSRHDNWLQGFPLRSFLELGAYPSAPGSARGHARNVLAEWGLSAFTEAVTLTVSELVTNSVAATQRPGEGELPLTSLTPYAPPVRLWLLGGAGANTTGEVMVLVWDCVAQEPVPREAGDGDESGRGLAIVTALSVRWDCYRPLEPPGGKVTRALINRPW